MQSCTSINTPSCARAKTKLTVHISTNDLHCWKTTHSWGGKTDVLSSANGPSTVALQHRCHSASASARSRSWPTMPRKSLQRAANNWSETIQIPILNRFLLVTPVAWSSNRRASRLATHTML